MCSLSAAVGSRGAFCPLSTFCGHSAALGNATCVHLAVLPGGHRTACGAGLPPHPVPSWGPSRSVEEEIQPLTTTVQRPHLPRVSLSAQGDAAASSTCERGCPSRPRAGVLGGGCTLHGGLLATPTGCRLPCRRLLPSSPCCSLLLPSFSQLTSGRPAGEWGAPSGTWHLPVAAHLLPQLCMPPTSSLQPVSAPLLGGSLCICFWTGRAADARLHAPSHDG